MCAGDTLPFVPVNCVRHPLIPNVGVARLLFDETSDRPLGLVTAYRTSAKTDGVSYY